MKLIDDPAQQEEVLLSGDELKLIQKYREMVEKLRPDRYVVSRSWSFPLIGSSGDSIFCSVALRFNSEAGQMSETEAKILKVQERR